MRHRPPSEPAASAPLIAGLQQALLDALDSDVAATCPRPAQPVGPATLARAHPHAGREGARALYARCLAHYRSAVRPQDSARGIDDLGAAAANFVAANMSALHGSATTPGMQRRLERQFAALLARSPAAATTRARQLAFEQLAILAVLIGESWRQALTQGPAALGRVQRAARGYLHALLGLDADALTLDERGLALRAAA